MYVTRLCEGEKQGKTFIGLHTRRQRKKSRARERADRSTCVCVYNTRNNIVVSECTTEKQIKTRDLWRIKNGTNCGS